MGKLAEWIRDIVPYVEPGMGSGMARLADEVERLERLAVELVRLAEEAVKCADENLGAAQSLALSPGPVDVCETDELKKRLSELYNELAQLLDV